MHSVFKEWVFDLPYRMQSVLVLGLRGCDTARKDDVSKAITRTMRGVVFNNADPTNTFIKDDYPEAKAVEAFLWDIDSYPMHFIMHLAHAAEIIGYKHPNETYRSNWLDFYHKLVKGLHVNPETEAQLDIRLGYTPTELKAISVASRPLEIEDKRTEKHRWDAGTGTSHGGRDRNWSGSS